MFPSLKRLSTVVFGPVGGSLEPDEWNVIISVISFFLNVRESF